MCKQIHHWTFCKAEGSFFAAQAASLERIVERDSKYGGTD